MRAVTTAFWAFRPIICLPRALISPIRATLPSSLHRTSSRPAAASFERAAAARNLAVYAVHEANGKLDLLVINKSSSGPITGQFAVAGFQPEAQAQVLQYGEAQDTAQEQSSNGQSALASFTAPLSLSGSSFSLEFPAYSMSVVELSPSVGAALPSATVHYTDSNDWKSGFVGDIMISNNGPSAIGNWTMKFNFPRKITAGLSATIVSHIGNQYVIKNANSSGPIAGPERELLVFWANRVALGAGPANLVLNGVPVTLSPQAPAPLATASFSVIGQSKRGLTASITITNMGACRLAAGLFNSNSHPKSR